MVSDGEIDIYYNGELETTIENSGDGNYFKAGAYTQANCDRSSPCSGDNYGEVEIYDLNVTHGDGDEDGGGDDGGENPAPDPGSTVDVSDSDELADAFDAAQAGDRIVLADGEYEISSMTGKHGTEDEPITVVAENRGEAEISDGQLEIEDSSYVTFEGLTWTNSDTLKITSSNNVRLTRNHFRLTEEESLKWVLIGGADSHHNRIDHNLFEEKHELGNFITIDGSETEQSQHDRIDHNHFRNIGPRAENEMEAIRVGQSAISESDGHTLIEHNLFEECDGDPEIISVKSNNNTVRYNTFRASQGTVTQRHGNEGQFYGNFFLGEGKEGTGGIRIYGQDHTIYNNHFEGLTGSGYDAALQIDGGNVDTSGALSEHFRVYRATVVNNTFVNNTSNIEIGANYDLAPVDTVIADNVVVGSEGKLFNELMTPEDMTYAGNIAWPTGSATVGVSEPDSAIMTADPLLTGEGPVQHIGADSPAIDAGTGDHAFVTDDIDGQPRTGTADIGADEHSSSTITRSPLNASDVGPDAA
ncbi:Chondroitinase-B precursor [Streptomyces sp. MP131-18]|nr:Chondroitinase-B precursor [Streptomyces sp. MP131-18]